jgi:hypothetical protein
MLNPSTRSTDNIITLINGYNIDDGAAEHLYDGSIIQDDGDTIWDGIVNFGNADVQIQIIQDGAIYDAGDDFWNYNVGAACDATDATGATMTDSSESWTTNQWAGYTVVNTTDGCRGVVASNTATVITFRTDDLHGGSNGYFTSGDNYLIGQPLCPNAGQGISHRFLIKVRADGADIDGRRLIGTARRMGNTYSEFKINGTSRGNNVLALTDAGDLNCTTANTTVIGTTWDTDFSGEDLGFQQFDVDDDATNEDYFGKLTWINSHTINDLYERAKGETEDGSAYTVEGLNGEIFRGVTHDIAYTGTDTWVDDFDFAVWGTNVATGAITSGPFTIGEAVHENTATPVWKGRILMVDDDTTTAHIIIDVTEGTVGNGDTFVGQTSGASATTSAAPTAVTGGGVLHIVAADTTGDMMYVQVIKGTAPSDTETLYDGSTALGSGDYNNTVTVSGAPVEKTISTPYIGVSTGSAIIGGYGVGIDDAKLSSSDKVLPLGETTPISPPTTVTNTVSGLVSGQDYVFVAPWDGTSYDVNGDPEVDTDQMTLDVALSGAAETQVEVNDIPGSTPDEGTIRVVNDEGFHILCWYSSYNDTTDIFTLIGTDTFVDGDVTVGTDNIASTDHGFKDQIPVQLTTTGTLPTGLSLATTYYIIRVDDDNFKLAADLDDCVAGTAVDITAASGGGTHTVTPNHMRWNGTGLNDSAAISNHAYVTYLDKLADATTLNFQAVHDTDLNLVALARDGGTTPIKQFISEWSFTTSNQSISVIRTTDT